MKKRHILLLLICVISICLFGLTACQTGKDPTDKHTHDLENIAAKSATCLESGNIEYWYCEDCNKYFSDAEAKTEITKAETLLEVGSAHTYGDWTIVTESTCAAEGKQEKVCSVCGDKQTQTIAKVAHTYGNWKTVTEPTCASEGLKSRTCSLCNNKESETIAKVAHTYGEWTTVTAATCAVEGKQEKVCSVCGDKQMQTIAKVAHTYGQWTTVTAATCTTDGKQEKVCSVCNDKQTQTLTKLGHNYGEWTTVTAPTCAVEGKQEKVCATCGDKQTQTLPKVAHTYGQWTTVTAATCTTDGTQQKVCSVCNDKQTQTITKLGHNYGEWTTVTAATCTTDGKQEKVCATCGDKQTQTLPKVAHTYGQWTIVTAATCTTDGKQEKVCSVCGDKQTQTITKLGHNYGEWTTVTAPTCAAEGKQEKTCSNCGDKQTQTLPKVAHTYGQWTIVTAATCTTDGTQQKVCSVCGDKQTQTLTKLGHNYGEWTTVTAATCTKEGKQERVCSACDSKETQTLPKLDHAYGEWVTVTPSTCVEQGVMERVCEYCGDKQTEYAALAEHTYGEWRTTTEPTCQKEGVQERICSVCNDKQTQTLPTVEHNYGEWLPSEAPTCQKEGVEKRYCKFCKDMQTRTLPKVEHKYGEWTTTMPSSCVEQGTMESVCEYCKDTKTQYLPLTDHTYGDWTTVTPATCTTDGKQEKVCSVCGDIQTQTLTKLGHSYGEWTIEKESTCGEEGQKSRTCSLCTNTETEAIPMLTEHTYGEWVTVTDPTCQQEGRQESHCLYCKEAPVKTQTLPKVEHKYGEWTTTMPSTCFEQGVQESVCAYCKDTKTQYLPIVDHEYDETGHCIYCQEALPPTECTHASRHITEVEGGHREICDTCQAFLSDIMPHNFFDNEYSYEEIDGQLAHGRKCIGCAANVIEKCTIIGPTYIEYYNGTEEINHKCHVWYCSECKRPDKEAELHSFYRSEELSNTSICKECNYDLCVYQGHTYEGGVCRFCGNKCPHENIMGMQTTHLNFYDDGTMKMVHNFECQDCGSVEEECTFNNGVCEVCQGRCEHADVWAGNGYIDQGSKHSCVYCGLLFDHEYSYIDRGKYCIGCGHECTHEKVVDCKCTICGTSSHTYGELQSDERGHFRTCSVCNSIHIESKHVFDEFGKCSKCDYINQSIATCVHEPSDRYVSCEGGHYATCKKCKMEYGEVLPHVEGENYVSSQDGNGHQKGCIYCYEGFGEVFSHAYDQNVNDREATCSVCYAPHTHAYDGETGVCLNCNHTCKHSGMFNWDMEGHRCEYCTKAFTHSFSTNGECTVCGYCCQHQFEFIDGVCSVCGFTCPHAASFNQMTDTEHECSFCHLLFPHNYDINGNCMQCGYIKQPTTCEHRYGEWMPSEEPTCQVEGKEKRYCELCNDLQFRSIPKIAHTYDETGYCIYCKEEKPVLPSVQVCEHQDYITYEDRCECNVCHNIYMHGDGPCPKCTYGCEHTNGFYIYAIAQEGHVCNRCGMVFSHSFDETGNCMQCGYASTAECKHENLTINSDCCVCNSCNTMFSHNETPCKVCGNVYTCQHTDGFGKYSESEHQCNRCGAILPHNFSELGVCMDCGVEMVQPSTCDHSFGFGEGTEQGHPCNRCGAILPHNSDGLNNCVDCGYILPCEHDFTGGGFAPFGDEGHCVMCVKCGASGEIIPHTQGNYIAEPGSDGHRTLCADCGNPYGELLPHVVEGDGSGSCMHCGEYHEHVYNGGVCSTCGHSCAHPGGGGENVDENYHRCWSCNEQIPHNYNDEGMCYDCGYQKSAQV